MKKRGSKRAQFNKAMELARAGDLAGLRRIAKTRPAILRETNVRKEGLLHVAGSPEVVDFLIANELDVNRPCQIDFTPLMNACDEGLDAVVQTMIDHGADVNYVRPVFRETALHCVVNAASARNLVKAGAALGPQDRTGQTALHTAVLSDHIDVAHVLIKAGAPLDAQDEDGNSCVHVAAKVNSNEVLTRLLEKGADLNLRANDTSSPLHVAARAGNAQGVRLLLEHGASPDATDRFRRTPYELARARLLRGRPSPHWTADERARAVEREDVVKILKPLVRRKAPMEEFDDFIERVKSIGIMTANTRRGCSSSEIAALEEKYSIRLPSLYRRFLEYCGHEAGTLVYDPDMDSDYYEAALRLTAEHREDECRFDEPSDALIIASPGYDMQLVFIRCIDAVDSPVYVWEAGEYKEWATGLIEWLNACAAGAEWTREQRTTYEILEKQRKEEEERKKRNKRRTAAKKK